MASTMSANTDSQNGRSKRVSNIGSSRVSSERPRNSHNGSMGGGFGGNTTWSTNIWANNLKNAYNESPTDTVARESAFDSQMSGSGSLLDSSESDGWANRPNIPWNTSRSGDRSSSKEGTDNSYFALQRSSAVGHTPTGSSHQVYLNTTAGESYAPSTVDNLAFSNNLGGFRNDDQRQLNSAPFGGAGVSSAFQSKSGLIAIDRDGASSADIMGSVAYTSFSQPGSEADSPGMSRAVGVSHPYSQMAHGSTSVLPQRPTHSAHPSFHSETQIFEDRFQNNSNDLTTSFHRLDLNDVNAFGNPQAGSRPGYSSRSSFDAAFARPKYQLAAEQGNHSTLASYAPDGSSEMNFSYPDIARIGDRELTASDLARGLNNQYYMAGNTPVAIAQASQAPRGRLAPALADGQAVFLERKLRGLQPDQDLAQLGINPLQRPAFAPAYTEAYSPLRFANGIYSVPQFGGLAATTMVQRPSPREHDLSQVVRSPLLEEFRNNNKGNKRYELKDIYNHVVEFSGDQHGSRFIQQKLETANSDEKEQVFREIQPNALQLMTDVFGNYVVQKLFEHGNQAQKKILANQMKGRVLTLSMQMYGCRVVQKALDHILTDQQAAMVKELENNVLRCVRDQNGNHVIQKAIEMVPTQHVQFIINAFKGQVSRLAMHPYGCRVVQRMLEHCEEVDRESILAELHASTATLIPDQYGNYVIQHVIENGEEKDRSRMINVVMSSVLVFSKHKFASNVVEKSIEFGEENQRREIIRTLTSLNEKGESPLLGLIRDQYGNYVIQKVLYQLNKTDRDSLVEQIQPMLTQLKKFSYGKQIVAIEKLLFELNSAPTSTSTSNANSSTTPPASHKSSPLPSRRSLTELETRLPVGGVAPPTPPPTDTQSQHDGSAHECSTDTSNDSCKMADTTTSTHLSHGASQPPNVGVTSS